MSEYVNFRWLRWALKSKTEAGLRYILIYLALHADDVGVCYPSAETLAEEAGVSRRWVYKALGKLQKDGLIEKSRKGRKSYYRIIAGSVESDPNLQNVSDLDETEGGELGGLSDIPPAPPPVGDAEILPVKGVNFDGKVPDEETLTGTSQSAKNDLLEAKKDHVEGKKKSGYVSTTELESRMTPEELEDFRAFWNAYPRKTTRSQALKSWLKTRNVRPTIETLLDCLRRYAEANWQGKDIEYIPHPATWLNQERWNDVLESEEHKKVVEFKPTEEQLKIIEELQWFHNELNSLKQEKDEPLIEFIERLNTFFGCRERAYNGLKETGCPLSIDEALVYGQL